MPSCRTAASRIGSRIAGGKPSGGPQTRTNAASRVSTRSASPPGASGTGMPAVRPVSTKGSGVMRWPPGYPVGAARG